MSEGFVTIKTNGVPAVTDVKTLSPAAEKRVEEIKAQYPNVRSAVMPALYIAQEEIGSINQDAVNWVASKIGIPPVQVWEVATFYTMYYKRPVGKYHIQVCRTLPCALRGAKKISEFLVKRLGINPGEITPDKMWSFEEVECLGSCGTAPMCQINDTFFEELTEEKLSALIDRIRKELPNLRFSTINDKLGEGLSGETPSKIR